MEWAWSKISTTICGFTFGSISLSKRIKDILTPKHQYNAKYLSRFNDKNAAFRKQKKVYIFFPDFSCICIDVCASMHVTFLVVEIADRFLGQALCG